MRRIAFINQRYGLEVNGGSEYYTRLMAEHLKDHFEVDILTTKAVDYVTWANYYKEDKEEINGVTVYRFPVEIERNMQQFGILNQKMLSSSIHTEEEEKRWIDAQGPVSPALIEYIEKNKDRYDVFIFVTYLYYTTCMGILSVPEKAILIPTAHDEPYIYFKYYEKVFKSPQAIIFLTEEERAFVHKKFDNENILNDVMAVGIEVPSEINAERFKQNRKIKDDYVIYVGRIDEGKGCKTLFQYFIEYKRRNKNNLKLVLMGKEVLKVPKHPDIINLGFVSEEEKFDGIKGARALILPSFFESLSISVLEAMAINVPVIVNGDCEVLKGHCVRSNAGFYYRNYFEFEAFLEYMNTHQAEVEIMKKNASEYVRNYFDWKYIMQKFEYIVEQVILKNNKCE